MNKASLIIAALSALVQYYDYHLFGFLAAKIAKNFLPVHDSLTVLLKTYLMMYLAVLMKPLGSIFLGLIGDIYGRQVTINIGLMVTACASFVLGILPSYENIGFLAPMLLLLLRICVVTFVSSGTDGIRIYIYESVSSKRKNLSSSLVTISAVGGSFLASISALIATLDFVPDNFWRLSFICGSFAGITIITLRNKFTDSSLDSALKKDENYEYYKQMPLMRIVKENIAFTLLGMVLAGGIGATYHFNFIFFGTYNFEILRNIHSSSMQLYISGGIAIYAFASVVGGFLADNISPRLVATCSAGLIVVLSIMQGYFVQDGKLSIPIYLAVSGLLPLVNIPCLTLLKSFIPKVIRQRLFSLVHALGSITISASTPVISTWLYSKTQIAWLPILYFVGIISLMALVLNVLFWLRYENKYDGLSAKKLYSV